MEVLTRYFSERSLLVNLIIVIAAFLGLQSIIGMQKEGFPAATLKRVFIKTVYPGASARDFELNVTIPIEDELRDISNVKETTSTSSEGISNITVVGDEDLSDEEFSRLYDDIGDALGRVNNLPKELESLPTYSQFSLNL